MVQGVGFRPFVYRLAMEMDVKGHVSNTEEGVIIKLKAKGPVVERFRKRIEFQCPPLAHITSIETKPAPCQGFRDFQIIESRKGGKVTTQISPDIATCPECLKEIQDPSDRRFGYAFTNCTNCGPRYTIIKRLPYDRPCTSMKPFVMCGRCRADYQNPVDRRFHAQPNACPDCGPRLFFKDISGRETTGNPLETAVRLLKHDGIIAIKGLGGFHLACSAFSNKAISTLRNRKKRMFKPFAIMAGDIEAAKRLGRFRNDNEKLLCSFSAPIVLVPRVQASSLSPLVAPKIQDIGIMLPSTPLHHLLFKTDGCPEALVMTSGNYRDEPLCTSNNDALVRLSDFVDGFLLHNRDIFTGVDDSVLRTCSRGHIFVRRSRGYAPAPIPFTAKGSGILGTGAELKNTFCLIKEGYAYPSQHIGNLVNRATFDFYRKNITHLSNLLEIEIKTVACDLHPDFLSTRFAADTGLPVIRVQHHFAHAASVMAEHQIHGPVVAICLDGAGIGTDGTVWGGEVLVCTEKDFKRKARLRPFGLPGGDVCAKSPWRAAISSLIRAFGPDAVIPEPIKQQIDGKSMDFVKNMILKGINSPMTSSIGRLFDAAAALCGICMENTYEAQAAMELETLCAAMLEGNLLSRTESFQYFLENDKLIRQKSDILELDWTALWHEKKHGAVNAPEQFSLLFHCFIVAGFSRIASRLCQAEGISQVVLSGGCMQNRVLVDGFLDFFSRIGIQCYLNRKVPANDAGISLGQAFIAANLI